MTLIPALLGEFPFLCMAPDIAVADEVAEGILVRVNQTALSSASRLVVLYSNLSNRTPSMRTIMSIISSRAAALGITSAPIAA